MSGNGTLVEDRFKGECAHFSFNKCPIYTQGGASAKFSTISHDTDKSTMESVNQMIRTPPPPAFNEGAAGLKLNSARSSYLGILFLAAPISPPPPPLPPLIEL